MKKSCIFQSKGAVFAQLVFLLSWLNNISQSASYFFTNGLVAFAGVLCLLDNYHCRRPLLQKSRAGGLVLAGVFSLASVLGNYELFEPLALMSLFNMAFSLVGGFLIGANILLCLSERLPLSLSDSGEKRDRPGRFFLFCFGSLAVIDLVYLVFAAWPGVITADTMNQIWQIDSGCYDNLNPFWHTQLLRLFLQPVQRLTGSYQLGVAVASMFQILLMSACFSYVLLTLYQRRFPRICLGLVWAFYGLVPYNIVYSITLWKDIPFSLACLTMTVSLYRILSDREGTEKTDKIIFFLSGLALCVARTNGILTYGILLLAVCLVKPLRKRKLIGAMAVILAAGCLLQGPVLTALQVSGGDYVETLSIPAQQIARVVKAERELTPGEQELLETAGGVETIRSTYSPEISDPIKVLIRDTAAYEAIRQNPSAYLKLWLGLGARYPGDYLKAWIDQTKGYWNGGYLYWVVAGQQIIDNDFGITPASGSNPIAKLFGLYIRYTQLIPFLLPLISIGLFTWILILCCYLLKRRNHPAWLLTLPAFSILAGLLIGTPVFAEFRYAYPMIISCPLVLCAAIYDGIQKEK